MEKGKGKMKGGGGEKKERAEFLVLVVVFLIGQALREGNGKERGRNKEGYSLCCPAKLGRVDESGTSGVSLLT